MLTRRKPRDSASRTDTRPREFNSRSHRVINCIAAQQSEHYVCFAALVKHMPRCEKGPFSLLREAPPLPSGFSFSPRPSWTTRDDVPAFVSCALASLAHLPLRFYRLLPAVTARLLRNTRPLVISITLRLPSPARRNNLRCSPRS